MLEWNYASLGCCTDAEIVHRSRSETFVWLFLLYLYVCFCLRLGSASRQQLNLATNSLDMQVRRLRFVEIWKVCTSAAVTHNPLLCIGSQRRLCVSSENQKSSFSQPAGTLSVGHQCFGDALGTHYHCS